MLKIKNISKSYGGKQVLNNISFEVKESEIAVLLGESGVGKSTVIRILNGLDKIDSGEILLDNKELSTSGHSVGMVFQLFNLFEHMTVLENITFPLEKVLKLGHKEAVKIAMNLLEKYGLKEKINEYPSGLSGGQKQRLALSRTIAMKPKVICLDEPTSALDPMLTTNVAHNIQDIAKNNFIVLVATHDTTLLEKLNCTIYLMEKGQIIETTNSKEFYENQNKFPKLKKFVAGDIS
ncbi:MAG: Amino acid ABC transporter, ATP-binding protein [candidate division TM6 bacterium GW2011_GWF2_32_72]|nr:MAG: Amino acid ABC transporter, ATP-binding protein [candidate division TM6 bacterium GW2011_GWF2_32_72]